MKRSLGLKAWKSEKAKQMSPEQINKQLEAAKKLEFQKGFEHGLNISLPPRSDLEIRVLKLENALELALQHGSFEQGSGVLHTINDVLYGDQK